MGQETRVLAHSGPSHRKDGLQMEDHRFFSWKSLVYLLFKAWELSQLAQMAQYSDVGTHVAHRD